MKKKFSFTDEVFKTGIVVMVGSYTADELDKEVKKYNSYPINNDFNYDARTIKIVEELSCIVHFKKKWDVGTIAHECFHIAHFMFDSIGIYLSDDSQETYAYYIEYLVETIYNELNPKQKE